MNTTYCTKIISKERYVTSNYQTHFPVCVCFPEDRRYDMNMAPTFGKSLIFLKFSIAVEFQQFIQVLDISNVYVFVRRHLKTCNRFYCGRKCNNDNQAEVPSSNLLPPTGEEEKLLATTQNKSNKKELQQ